MAFNFPYTPDESGQIISNAVQNALNFRRQRQFDQLALQGQQQGQVLQRAEAARQGIHFDQPGQLVPSQLSAPRVQVPTPDLDANFQRTIAGALQGKPNTAIPNAPTPNEREDAGELNIPDYTFFKGGYINNHEAMLPLLLQSTMAARTKGMEKTAELQAESNDPGTVAVRKSTIGMNNARANYYGTRASPAPTYDFITGPDGSVSAVNKQNPTEVTAVPGVRAHTPNPPQDHFTALQGVDPTTGQPVMRSFDTRTGKIGEPLGINPKPQGGALANMQNARLKIAAGQIQHADDYMTSFENDLLNKRASIGSDDMTQLKLAMSDNPVVSSAAEGWLNKHNPRLAQYFRAGKIVSSTERLVTPRGGSNQLMGLEGMLSSVGPNPDAGLIQQVRDYRKALGAGLTQEGSTPQGTPLQLKYDEAYQHLKAQGKKDSDIKLVIGERP